MFWDIISDLHFYKLVNLVDKVSPVSTCSSHIAVGNSTYTLGGIMAAKLVLTALKKKLIC